MRQCACKVFIVVCDLCIFFSFFCVFFTQTSVLLFICQYFWSLIIDSMELWIFILSWMVGWSVPWCSSFLQPVLSSIYFYADCFQGIMISLYFFFLLAGHFLVFCTLYFVSCVNNFTYRKQNHFNDLTMFVRIAAWLCSEGQRCLTYSSMLWEHCARP